MNQSDYISWKEAQQKVQDGNKVWFHHQDKAVAVDKETRFEDLQWKHFGAFGLTWNDILAGQYSLFNEGGGGSHG